MTSVRTRDTVLTLIAFAGWLLYILACASFSPDDSKVLFPSNDPTTGAPALAMYDRAARTTRTLLAFPVAAEAGHDTLVYVRGAWTPDGRHVVGIWGEGKDSLRATVLPLDGKEPARVLGFGSNKDDIPSAVLAGAAIVGSHLFAGDKARIVRLDLATGEVKDRPAEGEPLLVARQDQVYYRRHVPVPGASQDASDQTEVGLVDVNTLALAPLFTTREESAADGGFLAVTRDGSRVALGGTRGKVPEILIFENKKLARTVPIGSAEHAILAGNFQWSPDGAVLYVMTLKAAGDDQHHQFAVLEVPAGGGASRETPLLVVAGNHEDADVFAFQLDVSHDGKTLAAAATYLQTPAPKLSGGNKELPAPRVRPEDLALYLVDLSRPDRKVTKLPVPPAKVLQPQ
jgi:hypothetical protein